MGSDFETIPIIDVSPLLEKSDDPKIAEDEGVLKVVRQLDKACKEAGFFYVKGHGIPDSLIKEAKEVTRRFFDLPYEEKLKIKMSPATGFRGYQRIGENITKGIPDVHEAIDCYTDMEPGRYGSLGTPMEGSNLWPDTPSNFKLLMDQYIFLLKELSRKIMRGIALALGGPAESFEGEIAGDPFWVMRLIGYPGLSDSKNPEIKCNDIGCSVALTQIMVRSRSGDWIFAVPKPGTFVCNIGDMLKILSNGIYEPTLHRVINNSPKYRVSVAFFYEANFDTRMVPMNFCVEKTGGVARYEGAVYGEHLVSKVTTNFVM